VRRGLRRLVLTAFGRLPWPVRLALVRAFTPSFRVGAMCVVTRHDSAVLLVRHSYRRGWGLPGGLLQRGEEPVAAAVRETQEEVGVDLELDDRPWVVVDAANRRVDVIYRASMPGDGAPDPAPRSPEILEVAWFPLDGLPRLAKEAATALGELRLRQGAEP
jgi:ADP-ribose pyrophosphatase YjhB (NUDIX family)